MREILFRGKYVETGAWYEGFYIHLHKTTNCPIGDPNRFPDNDIHQIVFERMTDWELPNQHLRVDVDPETVGQYTGLTDKNGKKIFEGDIIEYGGVMWPVEFHNASFCAMDGSDIQFFLEEQYIWDHKKEEYIAPDYWNVIGNIHDNPELLEVYDGN